MPRRVSPTESLFLDVHLGGRTRRYRPYGRGAIYGIRFGIERTLTLALSQRERGQYPTLPIPDFYRWLAVADASHLATAGGLARLLGGLVRPPRLNDLSPLFYRPPKVPYTSADTTAIPNFQPNYTLEKRTCLC